MLAAHAPVLPQPDQLCGPFAAHVALHAVLSAPPSVTDLARAAGTAVWPHDVPQWRPAGAPLDTTGWSALRRATDRASSGTDAAGVARAVETLTDARVVPAAGGPVGALLRALARRTTPVGVVANVRTGLLGSSWDVGHFVVLHAVGAARVGVADTYAELGAPGSPPGCREVDVAALDAALRAAPGRGLLLLVRADDERSTRGEVADHGLSTDLWTT